MKLLTNLTDKQLIHLYMDGNADALATLVTRYKNKIFTSIYLLVKDKYLAEDIFQDVFIKVIDTLRSGKYTDEGKFLPWTMRIAHNMCVDHFRKVKRSPTIKTSDDRDIFEVLNFSEPGADHHMMTGQSHDRVRKMIDLLPEERDKMIEITGRMTVPQIFIGDTHVGGFDDLAKLNRSGDLDELLNS